MRPTTIIAGIGLAAALALAIPARGAVPEEIRLDPQRIKANEALVAPGPAGGPTAIAMTFRPAEWSSATVEAPTPWDWSRFGYLILDLKNPGPRPVAFSVRVDDDPKADGRRHCRTAPGVIGPGSSASFAVDFGPEPMQYGMRGPPGPFGARALRAKGQDPFDLHHILSFRISLHRPEQTEVLVLRGARLEPPATHDKIVDQFGQYANSDWPGKLHEEADLGRRRAEEEADFRSLPTLPGRDRFGGWSDGPHQAPAGFFRTVQVDGRWWLVDPDGNLFFSTGIDCVAPQEATLITGRESLFSWLPEDGTPLARCFGMTRTVHMGPVKSGRTFDFYRANLMRKFGLDAEPAWRDVALRRLPSWGFNTIGNWSDRRLYRNGRVPYTATVSIGGDHARLSSGSDYWGKMHDPFDPRFAADVERSLRDTAGLVRGDPWCIGYFVDNELSWGGGDPASAAGRFGLAFGSLGAAPGSPAKAELVAQLRRKYGTIERLNAAWDTTFLGWDALAAATWKPASPFPEAIKADLSTFVTSLARRYFQTVRDALKRLDLDHLYLGCRFAWRTPEAVAAAAESCDVVSFNIYQRRVEPKEWAFLETLGKPAIIGEFHVGALDRGIFHTGLVSAADQHERAEVFRGYVESVLDHTALVGCHWFQYIDQPLTGRSYDGENYNIGFVTVTDTPYPEMVAAARSVHRAMYPRRLSAGRATQSTR
jgi:hypothetical protein